MQHYQRLLPQLTSLIIIGLLATSIQAQPPAQERQEQLAEMAADAVLRMLNTTSCEDFSGMMQKMKQRRAQQNDKEPPFKERFRQATKRHPEVRRTFINKIAGPLANKMLDCGLVP
ncbi:MAG: hypothetical protein H6975_07095 [Gammaproteobacteria bacterium]|nr:hypothetical protein [Gammaproteobacteria bacterium]